jgi:hypothetical protein
MGKCHARLLLLLLYSRSAIFAAGKQHARPCKVVSPDLLLQR